MSAKLEQKQYVSTYHLQQHELVNFLFDRFLVGMLITFIVCTVAAVLAVFELELQGRDRWVYVWYIGMVLIQYVRYLLKVRYDRTRDEEYLSHQHWKLRFGLGVFATALWLGFGGAWMMPYVSNNLQFIIHTFLLGMGAGAIAYHSTSMIIYAGYLVLMMLPITIYLFSLGTPDGFVMGFMYVFMVTAYYFGVNRMHQMIADSMLFRFDNELLIKDLQRLLAAVATSNKELDKISTTDELTGVSNFRAFRVRLEEFRLKHISSKLPMSIVMINADFYYEYNVMYGQDIGNRTLARLAHLLAGEIVKKDEMVARFNGAEFGVLLPGISCEGARMIMEAAMDKLKEAKIEHGDSKCGPNLTVSVGICCIPVTENTTGRDMLSRADSALRLAKDNGRNRIEIVNT